VRTRRRAVERLRGWRSPSLQVRVAEMLFKQQ
jgi:hypothetical protein